ncbi:diguanylate cyclase [Pannus brasiliensis CCIBt3594]|uniref:Diguanylate cyclase n=1 Tax=Pannus brasiliensis CCIBt3594 TaxID=1427578 RepID=A0AAW9QH79_9CHRO
MLNHYPEDEITGDLLIVGEIPRSLEFILPLLKERGYPLQTTIETDRLLEIVQSSPISLILLNTTLQDPDAYALCHRLKSSRLKEPPSILFISDGNENFQPERVFQVGGSDYIAYPPSSEEILARIETRLIIARLQKNFDRQSEKLRRALQELRKLEDSMHQVYDELREFSFLDSLTRVAGRQRFEESLEKEWQRCARDRISWGDNAVVSLSLILCDLDYFKSYNDSYGIAAGDECLKKIARALETTVKRPADLVARFGGSSFALLLPNTNEEGALTVANLVREKIRSLQIPHPNSPVSEYVTLSYGVVTALPQGSFGAENLVRMARQALQRAKEEGRDRMISDHL